MNRLLPAIAPIVPLMTKPTAHCELADEVLHGMVVAVLEERTDGWLRVRTDYRYEGWARQECLGDALTTERWQQLPKRFVAKAALDVLQQPKVQSWALITLPRGALVAPIGQSEYGWQAVQLADGRQGYLRASGLNEPVPDWRTVPEGELRQRIVNTALLYMGTQYRWGGKTPEGIDCSGLCSIAYLLHGIPIWRDADIVDGFPMGKIPVEQAAIGDLIFMKGHVAMHLGDGRILHATARAGSDGVVLDSLNPAHEGHRADLVGIVRFAGTIF